jgi:hypothetical protein
MDTVTPVVLVPVVPVVPIAAMHSGTLISYSLVMEARKNKNGSPRPRNGSPVPRSLPLAWKRTHGQCREGPLVATNSFLDFEHLSGF